MPADRKAEIADTYLSRVRAVSKRCRPLARWSRVRGSALPELLVDRLRRLRPDEPVPLELVVLLEAGDRVARLLAVDTVRRADLEPERQQGRLEPVILAAGLWGLMDSPGLGTAIWSVSCGGSAGGSAGGAGSITSPVSTGKSKPYR